MKHYISEPKNCSDDDYKQCESLTCDDICDLIFINEVVKPAINQLTQFLNLNHCVFKVNGFIKYFQLTVRMFGFMCCGCFWCLAVWGVSTVSVSPVSSVLSVTTFFFCNFRFYNHLIIKTTTQLHMLCFQCEDSFEQSGSQRSSHLIPETWIYKLMQNVATSVWLIDLKTIEPPNNKKKICEFIKVC